MADVVVMGVFVADAAYRADRLPRMGETILGHGFSLGPGGKGSNQAVAAARAGARTAMLTRLGADDFAAMARTLWRGAGVQDASLTDADAATGSAFIFLEEGTGMNAIIVAPGAAARISPDDVADWGGLIDGARVFVTQLEQPLEAAHAALRRAREGGAITILNPAPAAALDDAMIALCDYLTPNEAEAESLTGIPVTGPDDATRAAEALMARGAGAVVVTLGAQGVLFHDGHGPRHMPAEAPAPVADTTGAGDAFTGALAAALAGGRAPVDAVRFALAGAGISVTRHGAAPAMPDGAEIDCFLASTAPPA